MGEGGNQRVAETPATTHAVPGHQKHCYLRAYSLHGLKVAAGNNGEAFLSLHKRETDFLQLYCPLKPMRILEPSLQEGRTTPGPIRPSLWPQVSG